MGTVSHAGLLPGPDLLTRCLLITTLVLVSSPGAGWAAGAAPPKMSPQATPTECLRPATTILIVRHADRAGQADLLSAAGVARAQALVHAVSAARVKAIYHSDTKRTRDTAGPLAAALGIRLEEYPAKDVEALVARILAAHEGETVLVVGHSNTVPLLIAAAGGPILEELDESEFDQLFIVVVPPCQKGATKLIELQYGEASP